MSKSDVAAEMNRFMYSFSVLLTFLFTVKHINGNLPERVLCNDPECSEPISSATTLYDYRAPHEFGASFKKNVKVFVVAKPEVGSNPDLWGVLINNKFGFAPITVLREIVVIKKPKIAVNIESLLNIYYPKYDKREEKETAKQIDSTLPSEPVQKYDKKINPTREIQYLPDISQEHVVEQDAQVQKDDNTVVKPHPDEIKKSDTHFNGVNEEKINKEFKETPKRNNLKHKDVDLKDPNQEPILSMIPSNYDKHNHEFVEQTADKKHRNTVDNNNQIDNKNARKQVQQTYEIYHENSNINNLKSEHSVNDDNNVNVIDDTHKPIINNHEENSTNGHVKEPKMGNNAVNTEHPVNADNSAKPIDDVRKPVLQNQVEYPTENHLKEEKLHNVNTEHLGNVDNSAKPINDKQKQELQNQVEYPTNNSFEDTKLHPVNTENLVNIDNSAKPIDMLKPELQNQVENLTSDTLKEANIHNVNAEQPVNIDDSSTPIESKHTPLLHEKSSNDDHVKDEKLPNVNTEHPINSDNSATPIDVIHTPILHSHEKSSNNDQVSESKTYNVNAENPVNIDNSTTPIEDKHTPLLHSHEKSSNDDHVKDEKTYNVNAEHPVNMDISATPIDDMHKPKLYNHEESSINKHVKEADLNTEHHVKNGTEPIVDIHKQEFSKNVPKIENKDNTFVAETSKPIITTHKPISNNYDENLTHDHEKEATINEIGLNAQNDNTDKIVENTPKPIEHLKIDDSVDINQINDLYKKLSNLETPPHIPIPVQAEQIPNQPEHTGSNHLNHVENVQPYIEELDNENETEKIDNTGLNSFENFTTDNNTEDDINGQTYESPYHQPPPSHAPLFHGSTGPHLFHYQPDSKETLNDKPSIDDSVTTEYSPVIDEQEVEIEIEISTAKYEKPDETVLDDDDKKSSFAFSFTIFGDLCDSILQIYKSSVFGTGDELKSDLDNKDNSHSSQNIMSSLFSETMKCNADERIKPTWSEISSDLIFWLVTSAISVLMFTLGYYYLENRKQDGKLLAMVNSLQKELLCSTKECIILKEDLNRTKEILTGIEDSSFGSNEMFASLKQDLAESQKTIEELEEKLLSTEEELANSTDAAFELQSILNEQLVSNEKSSSLAFTVTQLQTQLDDQQSTMNLTKSQLAAKMEENEFLKVKLIEVNNKSSLLEAEFIKMQESHLKTVNESEAKSNQINELTLNTEKSLKKIEDQKKLELKEIQEQLNRSKAELDHEKASLKSHKHEIQSLQDSLKALQLDEKNINNLIEVTHTNAELVLIMSEKAFLSEKVEADYATIVELTENMNKQSAIITEMRDQLVTAERNALTATTRLDVITNYFKGREAELLNELNNKEAIWLTQQGEATSITEKIGMFQKQIQQYKETSESLRREVAEQEAAWRARIADLEQRAHDEWLARRAAERSAEASAREAQALRQRLAAPSPDKRVVSPLTTGEAIADPAFMPPLGNLPPMMPPPPLGFLPNPLGGPMMMPPPFPLPPHRPPPLGRLSSPPPTQIPRQDRSYSPDSRYSPDRDYGPQHRARSPMSNQDRRRYSDRRYENNRYYDSEEERRSRRYDTETDFSPVNTLPPSPIPIPRNHKGISSGSGHSFESLERFK